ncbi:hypothetical protein [uncultured Hymenobacter sp.]|uniref:hypothetical protein n=1 Tax=uncultured Hymenobacter sp. TaxID=170016 RepID=UPI0035C9D358
MITSFDQLPDAARVWIYQARRLLTETELRAAAPALTEFVADWTSHGRALRAGAAFFHQQFLVIGLDESQAGASGCSIDASVHFVRALEEKGGVGMLDKSQLAFLVDGAVRLLDRRELRAAVAAGELSAESLYFDNTITTVGQLRATWPAPAGQTWLRKYFAAVERNVVEA